VKRDDQTSTIYGGGKVRKLEWLLANPPYDDDRPIVTIGGHGSHHLVATGLYLSRLGRELHAVMFEQEPTEHAYRNVAVLASIGSRFWSVRRRVGLPLAMAAYYLWRRPPTMGRYLTPGGSTALGSFGCVEAGLELAAQIEAGELPKPDHVYVTAGTAGTSAGIAIGMALSGLSTHMHLVSAAEPIGFNRVMFALKLREVFRLLREKGIDHPAASASALLASAGVQWSIEHGQLGGGYGSRSRPSTPCRWRPRTPASAWPRCAPTSPAGSFPTARTSCFGTRTGPTT
jgi:D-cysteine desulfhydrase